MEPRIQYAKTADGVSIAFWTLGEGVPLVQMPPLPYSHIQLEWQDPGWRHYFERQAEKRKLVRYDGRGSGLSDRNVADYSVDAQMQDLEGVVERLGVRRFALFAPFAAAPVALAYAARYPEAISHLVLWCPWGPNPRALAVRALREAGDWELYTESLANAVFGWSAGEEAHRQAAFLRECTTPEADRATFGALGRFDVAAVLSQVRSPTLILQRRQLTVVTGLDISKALASGIPDARLVLLEGASLLPWIGDMDTALAASDEFLGDSGPTPAGAEPPAAGGLCTILFTDVQGSTALTERLGDAKARAVLRDHERIVREALRAHGGAEVKAMGDGFMASFSSATRALECAITMQRAFAAHNESAGETISVRIGLNAGEPIAEDEDLFGTAVNMAARIAAQAQGGQILASDVVRQLVAGKGFTFTDRGEVALKGFADLMRLYRVQWHPTSSEPRGRDDSSP
jgi:class 3 adenylate cyclase